MTLPTDHYVLTQFIQESFGFELPSSALAPFLRANQSGSQGGKFTQKYLAQAPYEAWITDCLEEEFARELDALGLQAVHFAQQAKAISLSEALTSYQIRPLDWATIPNNSHYFHPKINHGFWENFLLASSPSRVTGVHLSNQRGPMLAKSILESRFFYALRRAFQLSFAVSANAVRIDFGFSFGDGSVMHPAPTRSEDYGLPGKRIRGTWAGSQLFFDSLGTDPPAMVDGGAAKQGLLSGDLEGVISSLAATADSIFFIVPDSFPDLFVVGVPSERHRTLRLSASRAASTWPLTLSMLEPVLKCLAEGHRTLVLAQGGPAASLIGLYLAHVVRTTLPTGLMHFLELGQALDHGVPNRLRGNFTSEHFQGSRAPIFQSKRSLMPGIKVFISR